VSTVIRSEPGPELGATPFIYSAKSADRLFHMHTVTLADDTTPVLAETHPIDPRMHLTGTLHQQGASYMLEQQRDVEHAPGPRWTTPVIHRLQVTDETRDAARMHIAQVVTITGMPGWDNAADRMSIVLDSIHLFEQVSPKGTATTI
jgi:hypothetical protein